MTTYTEQFAGMTVGVVATNFTDRWAATTDWLVQNPSDGEAEDDRAFTQGGANDGSNLLSFDDVDGDANRDNSEILCRFRIGSDTDQSIHFWHRASGSDGNRTGYLLWFDAGSGLRHGKFLADAFTTVSNGMGTGGTASPWYWWTSDKDPAYLNYPAGMWLWVRWRINGTGATVSFSAKIWADGQTEPLNWTHETTDTDVDRIVAAGWTGVGRGEFVTSTDTEVDYFSVATNGDTAAIATAADNPVVRITQHHISVAVTEGDPPVRITGCAISAAIGESQPTVRVTGSYKQVLFSYVPPVSPQSGPVLVTNS